MNASTRIVGLVVFTKDVRISESDIFPQSESEFSVDFSVVRFRFLARKTHFQARLLPPSLLQVLHRNGRSPGELVSSSRSPLDTLHVLKIVDLTRTCVRYKIVKKKEFYVWTYRYKCGKGLLSRICTVIVPYKETIVSNPNPTNADFGTIRTVSINPPTPSYGGRVTGCHDTGCRCSPDVLLRHAHHKLCVVHDNSEETTVTSGCFRVSMAVLHDLMGPTNKIEPSVVHEVSTGPATRAMSMATSTCTSTREMSATATSMSVRVLRGQNTFWVNRVRRQYLQHRQPRSNRGNGVPAVPQTTPGSRKDLSWSCTPE